MNKTIMFSLVLTMSLVSTHAFAKMDFFKGLKTVYPASAKNMCKNCHEGTPSDKKFNPFGLDVQKNLPADGDNTAKITAALTAVKDLDSDGDGVKNGDELTAGTLPGDKDSH